MPAPPQPYKDRVEPADSIKQLVVSYDAPVSGNIPIMRFPSAGRVLGGYIVSKYASAGTNVLVVGLKNGGNVLGGIGTIVVAPTNTGTVLAGSAYQLVGAIDGSEQFKTGDWLVLNIVSVMTPNAGFSVSIDYHLDAF
jgi:hypothetical protein